MKGEICLLLWQARTEALDSPELAELHRTVENGFHLMDRGFKILEPRINDHDLARIGGIFLEKVQ